MTRGLAVQTGGEFHVKHAGVGAAGFHVKTALLGFGPVRSGSTTGSPDT